MNEILLLEPNIEDNVRFNDLIDEGILNQIDEYSDDEDSVRLEIVSIDFNFKIRNYEDGKVYDGKSKLEIAYYNWSDTMDLELFHNDNLIESIEDISEDFLAKMSFERLNSWIIPNLESYFADPKAIEVYLKP